MKARGLATLAMVGLLTLLALGATLLALRTVTNDAIVAAETARALEREVLFEDALLHLLQALPPPPAPLDPRRPTACRLTRPWPARRPRVLFRLDRCRGGPRRVQVRLEALAAARARPVVALLVWRGERWQIRPGSWHDFAP
ncbi:MAG: hypothetical protein D6721_02040 [Gammaproteobacteria bacterium]|nr:MAG: hypothetical protein D6721_02040 [Gammaproteobacteria bacterium]